jgi:hypothetical protein
MKSRVIQDEPDRPDRSPPDARSPEPDAPNPAVPPGRPAAARPARSRPAAARPKRWKLLTQPTRAVILSSLIIAILISVLWISYALR